jgi:hypothetical protein
MNIQFRETLPIRGCFTMRIFRRGSLIERYQDHNLIVSGAQNAAARLLAGEGEGKHISKIAFGTSGNIPTPDDTEITSPFIKGLTSFSFPDTGQVEFKWSLDSNEANGKAIKEFGLLCEDLSLFARKVRGEAIPKEADISLEGEWIIIL